jgi:hypothetical protein
MRSLFQETDRRIEQFNEMVRTDVAAYNEEAKAAGVPTLFSPAPIVVEPVLKIQSR